MLPVLLIEDDAYARKQVEIVLKRNPNFQPSDLVWKEYYSDGLAELKRGIYPLVLVDLGLPAGKSIEAIDGLKDDFRGLDLIPRISRWNKDSIYAVFTSPGKVRTHAKQLISHVEHVLQKGDRSFSSDLTSIYEEVLQKFNYSSDVEVSELMTQAFGETNNFLEYREHWELCVRRLFSEVRNEKFSYNKLKGGKSGAGVVSVHFDDDRRRPIILKLDYHDRLLDESERCNRHALPYLSRFALTRSEDLAQAGEFGVLAYRLAGTSSIPVSLGAKLTDNETTPALLSDAISDHFTVNCKHWFKGFVDRLSDISEPFKQHFFSTTNSDENNLDLRSEWTSLEGSTAFSAASQVLETEIAAIVERIQLALNRNDVRVFSSFDGRVHGDLNIHNLIWDDGKLWLIDFARASDSMPITTDFVKLECSIKFDTSSESTNLEENARNALALEEVLCASLCFEPNAIGADNEFHGIASVLATIRRAVAEPPVCRSDYDELQKRNAYLASLFYVTTRQVFYLIRDIQAGEAKEPKLTHALISAYLQSKLILDL